MPDLPEGLVIINGDARCFRYTESIDFWDPGYVDFVVFHDGTIEVASTGAPFVPTNVLRWVADLADERSSDATGG